MELRLALAAKVNTRMIVTPKWLFVGRGSAERFQPGIFNKFDDVKIGVTG